MKIVGLCSTYCEGSLTLGAIRSLEAVGLDDLLVYEGAAGDPLSLPADLASEFDCSSWSTGWRGVHRGRWRTDGRKRDEMLQEAKRRNPGVTWGVWLDGDEILVHGEYLRNILQAVVWNDEHDGTGIPTIHWPMRVIEADGSISVTTGRLFRVDQVASVDISVSVITNANGIEEGWGNHPEDARLWIEMWMRAIDTGRMIAWPPLPCEPAIYHRSNLRHPLRRGLRLHEQESVELRKAGKL